MTNNEKQAMSSAYKAQVAKYGTPISEDLYKELRDYADAHKIRLSGFKDFVGDVETIKTVIDDIIEIAGDFPKILDKRQGIVLDLDYGMPDEDFATTCNGHVIHLNAGLYGNLERLNDEYKTAVDRGDFVANTDWRAIVRHETGHVVEFFYGFDIMGMTLELLGLKSKTQFAPKLMKELSYYATVYTDGREIIAESFSGYYSKAGNAFADAFVNRCIELKDAMGDPAEVTAGYGGDTMRANDEAIFWMRNDDWFTVDDERDCLELTPQAPERAINSFRLYLERNNLPTSPLVLRGDQVGHWTHRAVGV